MEETASKAHNNDSPVQVYSEAGHKQEVLPVDGKAYYLFGRDPTAVDILLTGSGPSRVHAALVHHEDGKTYLIDLQSVSAATELNTTGRCRARYYMSCC